MNKLKTYIYLAVVIIFLVLITAVVMLSSKSSKYKELYNKERQNVEAYQMDNSTLKGSIRQYQMTIKDLKNSNDSLDQKLMSYAKELKISNNKIKDLQYQLSQAKRVDTITLKDTIFIENTDIDTTFGDEWYNMHLKLKYPSTIITSPTFNSEQYVYIYTTKVYDAKASKCFFINWFKKKHTVVEVKVEEQSPYIKILKQKFIEVTNKK